MERESQFSYNEKFDDMSTTSYHIPRVMIQSQQTKQSIAAMGGVKVLPASPLEFSSGSSSSKNILRNHQTTRPKRVASFTVVDTELPIDYRQYLRHTNQADVLYGEEKQRQTNLEHSLGYLP